MRHFLMAAFCFVIFQPIAAAQTAPRLDRVRELAGLMGHDATFRLAVETILGQQHEAGLQQLDQMLKQSPENATVIEARRKRQIELHERVLGLFWKHIDLDACP